MALAAYLCFALALATLMCVRGYQKGSLNASGAALARGPWVLSSTATDCVSTTGGLDDEQPMPGSTGASHSPSAQREQKGGACS
mgnify:CR=1 FL=1